MKKSVAILGASAQRAKFGNKAVRAFRDAGYTVYPVNPHEKEIEGVTAYQRIVDIPEIVGFASFYLPPSIGITMVGEVIQKGIKEVYLNPGAESEEIVHKLTAAGIQVIQACSIRAHGKDPYDYPA